MTPTMRDRNLARVRRVTAVIAGASLVACGLFAGLAASVTQHVFAARATTVAKHVSAAVVVKPKKKTTVRREKETPVAPVTPSVVVVTPTPAAPVATSGGS